MIFIILTITGICLFELYGFVYRVTHPVPHPSTIPGMIYSQERQEWVDKEGRLYGCARVPVGK